MPRMSSALSDSQRDIAIEELRLAIKLAGSQKNLGEICGVTQGCVYQWSKNYGAPADRAVIISRKFKNIRLNRLRPELFGDEND